MYACFNGSSFVCWLLYCLVLCYLDAADVVSRVENTIKNQVKKQQHPAYNKSRESNGFFFYYVSAVCGPHK